MCGLASPSAEAGFVKRYSDISSVIHFSICSVPAKMTVKLSRDGTLGIMIKIAIYPGERSTPFQFLFGLCVFCFVRREEKLFGVIQLDRELSWPKRKSPD